MTLKPTSTGGQPSPVEEELENQFDSFLSTRGYDLIEVTMRREHRGWVLRFTVNRTGGGLTVDEGVKVSRELSAAIEADPRLDHLLPGPYNLEVSSPGIFRPLKRDRDFEQSWGKRIKVGWREPAEGRSLETVGVLTAYGNGTLSLDTGTEKLEIDVENILSARLEPELPFGR